METTVNQRIMKLKKELYLNDVEFCGKAEISTFTLHKIKNNEEVRRKVINSIVNAYNVNPEWLFEGKGNMFNEVSKSFTEEDSENPWRDALVSELKSQVEYLKEMLKMSMQGKPANFNDALENASKPVIAGFVSGVRLSIAA